MRSAAIVLALSLVLAGCSAPAHVEEPGVERSTAPAPESTPTTTADGDARPDPESDSRGWERGRWYDESLSVTVEDGLNETELDAVVARAMARVERLRAVEFDRPVEVTVRSRAAYRNESGGGSDGGTATGPSFRAIKYEALFLVGDTGGGDGGDERERTREATVRGYYDVGADEIVLVTDDRSPTVDEVTLAQELVHAYQFRHLDPGAGLPERATDDHVRALRAVIEGDANLVDRMYERRCRAGWDCVGVGDESAATGGDAGDEAAGNGTASGPAPHLGLYVLQYFPYAAGERYVRGVYREEGWAGVEALYDDPPASSEQVIHPERGDDPPEFVLPRDRSARGWERIERPGGATAEVVGEAGLATMFIYPAYDDRSGAVVPRERFLNRSPAAVSPLTYDVAPAAGWAGDALVGYAGPNGSTGYVWSVGFDTEGEAREFADAYRDLLAYHDGERADGHWTLPDPYAGAIRLDRSGRVVRIVHAPSGETLDAVHDGE